MPKMKAAIFVPAPGPLDALLRVATTTICGTDVHILRDGVLEIAIAP